LAAQVGIGLGERGEDFVARYPATTIGECTEFGNWLSINGDGDGFTVLGARH